MAETIIPFTEEPVNRNTQFMQVNIYIKADVMTPATALRKANVWLSMNAGHLLLAENPELVVGEPLQWRFDVIHSLPQRRLPGMTRRTLLGRMQMNATSGDIHEPERLIKSLSNTFGSSLP